MGNFVLMELIRTTLKTVGLSVLAGIVGGISSAIFLWSLEEVTTLRVTFPFLILLMPVAGLLTVWLYQKSDPEISKGNNALLEQFHQPTRPVPGWMAPVIFITTLLGHLGGASVGREGTAVQMSGALSDVFTRIFRLSGEERKNLLLAAIAAGFSGVFGTPLAAAWFAIEVPAQGKWPWKHSVFVLIAAWVAHFTCELFPINHTQYQVSSGLSWKPEYWLFLVLAGVTFGLVARLFVLLSERIQHFWKATKFSPYVIVLIASLLMAAWFYGYDDRYAGLGIQHIQKSFTELAVWYLFLGKLFFTAFSLQSGFKGGEVTPLFFIGAALGSALSLFMPVPVDVLAAMGFAAVFGACAKTPVACVFMGMELFGWQYGLALALTVGMAYYVSGPAGIYSAQLKSNRNLFFPFNRVWKLFSAKR